ncbi:winged helix-turn-helix transcriptional regulator [Rathayibacter sp. KR2-224]|uniref:winged helix-turn-helix transcriptional regulator n=1 Tax=Rathayibacter sp. KR2-224 TaxID=3400913 RepID=UPI003C0F7A53
MKSLSPVNQRCGIARSLDVLGEKWTLLVVRDVRLGFTRFRDIRERLGITPDVLADRLAKLVDLGVLERQAYRDDGARTRDEYVLTASGEELAPVLAALQAWGNRHLPNGMEPASRYVAADTREPLHIAFVDSNGCERDLDRIDVELLPLARSAS